MIHMPVDPGVTWGYLVQFKVSFGAREIYQNTSLPVQVVYYQKAFQYESQTGPICCWQLFLHHWTCLCHWNTKTSRRANPRGCYSAEIWVQKVGERWLRMWLPPSAFYLPAVVQSLPQSRAASWQRRSLKKLWIPFPVFLYHHWWLFDQHRNSPCLHKKGEQKIRNIEQVAK